jgi:hypothetical protein
MTLYLGLDFTRLDGLQQSQSPNNNKITCTEIAKTFFQKDGSATRKDDRGIPSLAGCIQQRW